MMLPHWKYALSVFCAVFAVCIVVFVAFALFGGKAVAIVVTVGGLLSMFFVMAIEGPK